MSHLLWKYYWENDVERFRRLLAPAGFNAHTASKSPSIVGGGGFSTGRTGSPVGPSGSRARRSSGYPQTPGKSRDINASLGRSEINSRDYVGLTVLLRAASSTNPNARDFVQALVDHPATDLYVQDLESGWNALHRSLYAGNISIARLLLEKERDGLTGHKLSAVSKVGLLIKTKDHEGNSPFDLYNSTIAVRSLDVAEESSSSDEGSTSGESDGDSRPRHIASEYMDAELGLFRQKREPEPVAPSVDGDELFVFGSNKNLSLGVGDEDDRQYPERIHLKRPDILTQKLYNTVLSKKRIPGLVYPENIDEMPTAHRHPPLVIQDVVLSKLHSAILTTDPCSNLYICGIGRGGRLGLGDENTQFKFVPIEGPFTERKIYQVALGQNHTMAVLDHGELWTWGLNTSSQLGYVLPPPIKADEEPMSLVPRQVFGSLKRERVLGVAASAHHSVAHTGSSLYCWGRNVGQLALMDADSRSRDVQQTPRKVAASLLTSQIEMVSAIDKATTVLLANHSVWVFANYGYNLIKFPIPDIFINHALTSTPYNPGQTISFITSGGDTIAALTTSGDLYTIQLNNKNDLSVSAASTTNPVKIKGALAQPHCIWDSRKDGVASVSIGENGSVIICTKSGSVWRRVKRTKGKITGFVESDGSRRKDFKFQRVPYITNCVAVRSSIFGAFAAIRRDSKVMSTDMGVSRKTFLQDLGALLCLEDFKAQTVVDRHKIWKPDSKIEPRGTMASEIMRSTDIENDLIAWLNANSFRYGELDMEICTSAVPDLKIPVHSWVLAARSSVLQNSLSEFRRKGSKYDTDSFSLETVGQKGLLTMFGIDVLTLLNLLGYAYECQIIPVWDYWRQVTPQASARFRKVKMETVALADHLSVRNLQMMARMNADVTASKSYDFRQAISRPEFFEDADVVIELEDAEVPLHSQLLCQRCPFFKGMFFGRSQGQWLTNRRDALDSDNRIRIDFKHVRLKIFDFVVRFLYTDDDKELFDEVKGDSLDGLSEIVLDVMSIANELMLDRLSRICQHLLGKFVNARNISNLLNEISPCSVTKFKDTGLEYICLQLELMLENHLLDDLDPDLLLELDSVVRENQLARLPFARSSKAELDLYEKYPELVGDIDEERRTRVKDMAFRLAQKDEEKKLSSSFKMRAGSFDEFSPLQNAEVRRKPTAARNEPFSPSLRPKQSQADLIFEMEEEEITALGNPKSAAKEPPSPRLEVPNDMPQLPQAWREPKGKGRAEPAASPPPHHAILGSMSPELRQSMSSATISGSPWASTSLTTPKFDLKDIMSEASSTSALTAGLGQQKYKDPTSSKPQAKVSQKERKRQLQMQAAARASPTEEQANRIPWEKASPGSRAAPAPWETAQLAPKTSLKDTMAGESRMPRAVSANAKPLVASETGPKSSPRRTASPDTRFPGQGRTNSSTTGIAGTSERAKKPLVPHSRSYITTAPKTEPTLGVSMADIMGQQTREQELVKEAVAKRSLQDIQQEQAFQEWWDQESRRAQEEETRKQNRSKDKEATNKGARRGRRSRGGKQKAGEATKGSQDGGESSAAGSASSRGRPSSGSNPRASGVGGRGRRS